MIIKKMGIFFCAIHLCFGPRISMSQAQMREPLRKKTWKASWIEFLDPQDPAYAWMDEQITADFSSLSAINASELYHAWNIIKADEDNFSRYTIVDSQVFGPAGAIKDFLSSMTTTYNVPDVDFIYCYGDDLFTPYVGSRIPIFMSTSNIFLNHKSIQIILFADRLYDLNSDNTGWNKIIIETNKLYSKAPIWEKKFSQAWWRGVPSDGAWGCRGGRYKTDTWMNCPRGKAVYLSHHVSPQDINASFFPFGHVADLVEDYKSFIQVAPISPAPPRTAAMCYKYHLNFDGQTATFPGYQWRLLTGGLTFKQDSPHIMWFYAGLKPWVHYIPVDRYCNDLIDKIRWAKSNDNIAKNIAQNAREFALNNLMPKHMMLYCYKVLCRYAQLQTFAPTPYTEKQRPRPSPYTIGNMQ